MAGEHRGKLLEAVVFEALRPLIAADEHVYWDQKHPGLTIRPDLLICGPDDAPKVLFQITWSDAQCDLRPVKYWRDLSELDALHRRHDARALLITATRSHRRCSKIAIAAAQTWDSTLCLEEQPCWADLSAAIEQLLVELAEQTGSQQQLPFANVLRKAVTRQRSADSRLDAGLTQLTRTLATTLDQSPLFASAFWTALDSVRREARPLRRREQPVDTALRAGFAELVVFDADERAALYRHHFADEVWRDVPEHAELAGILEGPTLRGFRIASAELRWCLDLLGSAHRCEALIAADDSARDDYVTAARETPLLRHGLDWVCQQLPTLREPEGLADALRRCYEGALPLDVDGRTVVPASLWLYAAVKALLRALGLAQGWLDEVAQRSGAMRSVLSGRVLPAFQRRQALPPAPVFETICQTLAARLRDVDPRAARRASRRALDNAVRLIMRNKLTCHGVDPLRALILEQLDDGLEPQRFRIPSAISEMLRQERPVLGFSDNDLSTEGLRCGATFIKWQSAHGHANATHKAAELAGRLVHHCLEYRGGVFRHRQGVERFVLVLDGRWSRRDLTLLGEAGWDVILGADELSELKTYI